MKKQRRGDAREQHRRGRARRDPQGNPRCVSPDEGEDEPSEQAQGRKGKAGDAKEYKQKQASDPATEANQETRERGNERKKSENPMKTKGGS